MWELREPTDSKVAVTMWELREPREPMDPRNPRLAVSVWELMEPRVAVAVWDNMTSFFKKSGEQDMLLGMYSAGSLPILSHFCKHKTLTDLFAILYIEKGYYPIPLSKAIYYSQLL